MRVLAVLCTLAMAAAAEEVVVNVKTATNRSTARR